MLNPNAINLLGETYPTTVNGPGNRYMIHFQGCSLGCKNCFNPESWSPKNKNIVHVEELAQRILQHEPDGLTISGGEPFQQIDGLLQLLRILHKDGCPFPKGILIYSGYYDFELLQFAEFEEILKYVDVIVSGRYVESLRVHDSLLSSSNQNFIWGSRQPLLIQAEELNGQDFEIVVDNHALRLTGFIELTKADRKELQKLGVEMKAKQS